MLPFKHSAILSTFIKLTFVTKIFVLAIFEWPFYTGFTIIYMELQSTFITMTLFVLKYFEVKLNFYCKELQFKISWYICATTNVVVKNFAVIKNVTVKSFHWILFC